VTKDWAPLSRRQTGAGPDGPYKGMRPNLSSGIVEWFRAVTAPDNERLRTLALRLRPARPAFRRDTDAANRPVAEWR